MSKEVSARTLGIDLGSGDERELFRWFLASFLFGKRIQQDIAVDTYRVIVEKYERDTPRKLGNCSRRELVSMLGEGRYVRYDESTAERLLGLSAKIQAEYGGKIGNIQAASKDREDFEKRLQEFKGVGPKTVEIFMREAATVWY